MSIRQEHKAQRAGQKDKNGQMKDLSRPVRRAQQRLQRRVSDYEATGGKCPESGHSYCRPGKQESY